MRTHKSNITSTVSRAEKGSQVHVLYSQWFKLFEFVLCCVVFQADLLRGELQFLHQLEKFKVCTNTLENGLNWRFST